METRATNIYEALALVMDDVDHVAKRDRNKHQNFTFRGIDAVVNAVGPALRKHRVIVVPQVLTCDYENVHTTTGKATTSCRIIAEYTFYAVDGSSVTARVAAEAFDSGDKATPKAMSVAFRTALLQALALPTDEPDPDSETYERAAPTKRVSRQQPQVAVPETAEPKEADEALTATLVEAATRAMDCQTKAELRDIWNNYDLDTVFVFDETPATLRRIILAQIEELEEGSNG